MVNETYNVSPEAAGRLMEPVPDGLSAHGMCVFVAAQCESPLVHLPKIIVRHWRCVLSVVRRPPGGGASDG